MQDHTRILGVDVGGVIIDRLDASPGQDTGFFGSNWLQTPAVPGAFETLAVLAKDGPVFLVSKCGKNTERKTREWLVAHDFHAVTGIPADNLRFCRERPEKAPICEALGVTHFVDDRLEVLSYLVSVPDRFLFRPDEEEVRRHAATLPLVKRVETWAELETRLRRRSGA